jgi:hypothetical protein
MIAGDCFQQCLVAYKMHVGIDREPRRGQQTAERGHVFAVQPQDVGQAEPARNAAIAFAGPVVIDKPLAPHAPERRIITARDQARILVRYPRLVVVAIERPGLHLALRASAAMQELMERMQPVIALGAEIAQRRFQSLGRKQSHSVNSMPS